MAVRLLKDERDKTSRHTYNAAAAKFLFPARTQARTQARTHTVRFFGLALYSRLNCPTNSDGFFVLRGGIILGHTFG